MWRKSVFGLVVSASLAMVAAPPAKTVVVELFTSEGCSSCPPADLVLERLESGIGVLGVSVIALGEHVTYWDRLGWKDRFSADAFTKRQEAYSFLFRNEGPYTPQVVVNGQAEFVGSDEARARKEILKAAQAPTAQVELTTAGDMVNIKATELPAGARDADVVLAVTETRLDTDVQHGENGGRKLRHTGVVRTVANVGRIDNPKDGNYAAQARYHLDPSWKRENLKLVVFLQNRKTKRIWGAGAIALK
ncbi:MAG: DUF1223 domain-containing protein [Acidobacteriota bacterium]